MIDRAIRNVFDDRLASVKTFVRGCCGAPVRSLLGKKNQIQVQVRFYRGARIAPQNRRRRYSASVKYKAIK